MCKREKEGFTLIELLVVISIIALLVSILMPALAKARKLAKRTVCMTRLKELGTASFMYASEHNDRLPYDRNLNGRGFGLLNYSLREVDGWINQGRLYESGVMDNPEVYYCPSEKPNVSTHDYDIYWSGGQLRDLADRGERVVRVSSIDNATHRSRVRGSYLVRPIFAGERSVKKTTDKSSIPYMSDRWTYGGSMHMGEYFNVLYNGGHVSPYQDHDKEVIDCGDDGAGEKSMGLDTDGKFKIKRGWQLLENK